MDEQKKALQLASVASMIDQFNIPNIEILQSLGYQVDVVADFTHPGNISVARSKDLQTQLISMGARPIDIAVPRLLNPQKVLTAYKEVKKLIRIEHYDIIHCHSPIGGAITRLAAKKERTNGTRVIYTAHGFHFYTGAPLKNWLIFYPVEKLLSKYTDVLITINKEDYDRAKRKFRVKKIAYVPGIGIDTEKFAPNPEVRNQKRLELKMTEKDIILLSVGELNMNKNHKVVVEALALMSEGKRSYLHYFIAGKDAGQGDALVKLAKDKKVNLHLLGYRTDIADLLNASDIFILPSIREGLNVSIMEAMSSGLPCVASYIRGNGDLIDDKGGYLVTPKDAFEWKKAIVDILESALSKKGLYNRKKIQLFSKNIVMKEMEEIYGK